ncbi:MAG: T9SS type A sorting domain-containing protein [Flaviramulus sp.]|nr:T9SS type A sorting domain-containing protein [Flaviramulus sp.]NNC49908.1 T9SS type A sorting domain-containing protein [Flaviramulus sp.]
MNNITKILFVFFISIVSNAQTIFEWETGVQNDGNVTETIDGITVTAVYSDVILSDEGGFGGSTGNIILSLTPVSTATFSFTEAVIVNSILALSGNEFQTEADYTFTPTGGSNQVVVASLTNSAAQVTLNWTDVTSFTVTSAENYNYGFDNLLINDPVALSVTAYRKDAIKVYPNPSENFLYISDVQNIKTIKIYNSLGRLIKKTLDLKIDISQLYKGIYFLQIETNNRIETKKIIKK